MSQEVVKEIESHIKYCRVALLPFLPSLGEGSLQGVLYSSAFTSFSAVRGEPPALAQVPLVLPCGRGSACLSALTVRPPPSLPKMTERKRNHNELDVIHQKVITLLKRPRMQAQTAAGHLLKQTEIKKSNQNKELLGEAQSLDIQPQALLSSCLQSIAVNENSRTQEPSPTHFIAKSQL